MNGLVFKFMWGWLCIFSIIDFAYDFGETAFPMQVRWKETITRYHHPPPPPHSKISDYFAGHRAIHPLKTVKTSLGFFSFSEPSVSTLWHNVNTDESTHYVGHKIDLTFRAKVLRRNKVSTEEDIKPKHGEKLIQCHQQ